MSAPLEVTGDSVAEVLAAFAVLAPELSFAVCRTEHGRYVATNGPQPGAWKSVLWVRRSP